MPQVREIEQEFISGASHLEVICGPMFSGKTEELIRRIRRCQYAGLSYVVFKPKIDTRFSKDYVTSHSEQQMASLSIEHAWEVFTYLDMQDKKFRVVGFDEAQFFDEQIIEVCEKLVTQNIRVIVAGLCQDYRGFPFGAMPQLLACADEVTKLWAVCMKCGRPASKSQRLAREKSLVPKEQVMIGAADYYEARCRTCHENHFAAKN